MADLVHLALIMDGNGRWAEKRSLPRSAGHLEGGKAALKAIRGCLSNGIRYLTLFCFSTENWKRPIEETSYLMGLFSSRIRADIPRAMKEGIRILHLGRREGLSEDVLNAIDETVSMTKNNSRLYLQLAINYSGLDEIVRAAGKASAHSSALSGDELLRFVDNPDVPPPDFIVRSSGEKRLSGFLLLQSSYAELGFYDKLWPEWDEMMIDTIIDDFSSRERRFGGI